MAVVHEFDVEAQGESQCWQKKEKRREKDKQREWREAERREMERERR